jgi:hypothetical protein
MGCGVLVPLVHLRKHRSECPSADNEKVSLNLLSKDLSNLLIA